jgi:hypothetical protein
MAPKKTLRVLAIDDDPMLLELYRESLGSGSVGPFSFEVEYESCETGESAVDSVKNALKAQTSGLRHQSPVIS